MRYVVIFFILFQGILWCAAPTKGTLHLLILDDGLVLKHNNYPHVMESYCIKKHLLISHLSLDCVSNRQRSQC